MTEQIPNTIEEIKMRQAQLEIAKKQLEIDRRIAELEQTSKEIITPPETPKYTATTIHKIQTPTIKEPSSGTITKRVAALESIKHIKTQKTIAYMTIAGAWITAIGGAFNQIGGAVVAVLVTGGTTILLFKAKREEERLSSTYNINLKVPQ